MKRLIKTIVEESLYDEQGNLIKYGITEKTETEYLNKNSPVLSTVTAAQPPLEEEHLIKANEANLIKPKKVIPPVIKKAAPPVEENLIKVQTETEANLIKTEQDITEACENLIKTQELNKADALNKTQELNKPQSFLQRLNAARAQQNLNKIINPDLNKANEPAPVEVSAVPAAPAASLNKISSADEVSAVEYVEFDLASL